MYNELNEVSERIIKMSGIDIFKNTRVTKYIELRSLACYIFRVKMNEPFAHIANFFESKGKSMDHATVIHAVKRYSIYKNTNDRLKIYESCIKFKKNDKMDSVTIDLGYQGVDRIELLQNKCKKIEKRNNELKRSIQDLNYKKKTFTKDEVKILMLVEGLPKPKIKEVLERINLMKQSWSWKSQDRCEIIESSNGLSNRAF